MYKSVSNINQSSCYANNNIQLKISADLMSLVWLSVKQSNLYTTRWILPQTAKLVTLSLKIFNPIQLFGISWMSCDLSQNNQIKSLIPSKDVQISSE